MNIRDILLVILYIGLENVYGKALKGHALKTSPEGPKSKVSKSMKSDEADMRQLCADNTNDSAYKKRCYNEWLDKSDEGELLYVKKTPLLAKKIKISVKAFDEGEGDSVKLDGKLTNKTKIIPTIRLNFKTESGDQVKIKDVKKTKDVPTVKLEFGTGEGEGIQVTEERKNKTKRIPSSKLSFGLGKHVKSEKDEKNTTKSKPIPTKLLTESIDFHAGAGKSVKEKGKKLALDKTNKNDKAPIVDVDRNIGAKQTHSRPANNVSNLAGKNVKPKEPKKMIKSDKKNVTQLDLDWDIGETLKFAGINSNNTQNNSNTSKVFAPGVGESLKFKDKKSNKTRNNASAAKVLSRVGANVHQRLEPQQLTKSEEEELNLDWGIGESGKFYKGKAEISIMDVSSGEGDTTENRAVINNGETRTDYPFVVSAGPKANIHMNGNSKIKIGNDHDEDLVDDYDDEDGEGEKGGSRRHKKASSKIEAGSGENKDFTSGESANANSIPIQDMEGNGLHDLKEENAEDDADDDEPVENEDQVKSAESSGSGSGEVATEYSGEADYYPDNLGSGMAENANKSAVMLADDAMPIVLEKGKQIDQTAQLNSSASFQPSSSTNNGQNAQPADMRQTYMLPLTDKQCDTLQQYANENSEEIKETNFQKNPTETDDSSQRSGSTDSQKPMTNGDYIISQTDPGDMDTFRKMIIKLAHECYAAKIKEIEGHAYFDGKLVDMKKGKHKRVKTTRKYKILTIPEGSKQLINLPNIRKLNQSFATLQFLPVIGPIQEGFFSPNELDSEKRHTKQGQHSVGAAEREHDYSGDEEEKEHGGIRTRQEEKKKFVEVEFPDYTKIDLNALKRGGSTKSDKQKKGKTIKAVIKTTAFEFDKGELGHNTGPVVVPAIRNTPNNPTAEVKGTSKKEIKEEWIVKNVKINKDIKSILSDFNGVQPTYTATAGAPQALPVPQQMYQQQQVGQLVNRASPNLAPPASQQQGTQIQRVATPSSQQQGAQMQRALPPSSQQQGGTQMQHVDAPSSQQQGAQMQQQQQQQQQQKQQEQRQARLIPNGAANFLTQGVSSRLINSLSSHSSTAVVHPLTNTSAEPNFEQRPCQSACQTSCTSECDPNCCRSSFGPAQGSKEADPGTLTAEILPIPDNLNKALADAGIGPGATAQILPTKENLKILKDAGYGAGVTAQVVPIPTDVEIVGNPMNVNSRSGAKPPQMIATFPQLSKLLSTNKQTPNVAVTQPAQTPHPQAAQPVVSYQQQKTSPNVGIVNNQQVGIVNNQQVGIANNQQVGIANNQQVAYVPRAAANPNVQSAVQQSFPQQPSTTYKDPAYLDPISRSDSPANPAEQQAPPPAEVQKLETGPKVEQLPPGQTNYDQDSYKQILAELPPSVAPDQPIAASVPIHKPQQLTVNDMGTSHVNMFFSDRTKHQDPLQNLQAYKRQQFKDLDMAEDR